jgi:urocanate hydratase
MTTISEARTIRAPRGTEISCRGWQQEAALRMLMNNLDPDVAERPDDLVVYGGTGQGRAVVGSVRRDGRHAARAGRRRDDAGAVREAGGRAAHAPPRAAGADREQQPGAALGQLGDVPRAGAAGAHHVRPDDGRLVDLHRHAGDSAGTYETFGAVARQHFGGTLQGTWTLTGGVGGMGGAQPLAITMNGGAALCIDVDPWRIERRIGQRYCDRMTADLDEALRWTLEARDRCEALSVGLVGNCAEVLPELVRRGVTPDVLTDQTSAHDALVGYLPAGMSLAGGGRAADRRPGGVPAPLARSRCASTARRWWR